MPKATPIQESFNAGELSPLIYGRVASPRYKQGLAKALNYLPTLQGPIVRRPGTKYVNNVKDSTKPPVFIPFQFSITQAYMLEFGDQYIRFYANNGQVLTSGTTFQVSGSADYGRPFYATRADINPASNNEVILTSNSVVGGSILELQSPYAWTDVPNIKFVQNADTMYLVHPNYPPFKLQRAGQQFWSLYQVYFQDGPYLKPNSYKTVGDSTQITLTPLGTGPVTAFQAGPAFNVSGAVTDPLGSGQIQITTSAAHNFVSGQNVFITGIVGTTEANNYDAFASTSLTHGPFWKVVVTSPTTLLLLGSAFVTAYTSGGTVRPALFALNTLADLNTTPVPDKFRTISLVISGVRYWGVMAPNDIHTFMSQNASIVSVDMHDNTTLPATTATAWQMGVWCPGFGFPSCVTFHENRLVFAGAPNYPMEVDSSNTGLFETFSPSDPATLSTKDNNSLSFNLASEDANAIRWLLSSAQGLLAGTYVAEWAMTPSTQGEFLTPTNFNAKETSFHGSSNVQAIKVGNAAIYVQRSGRKVRELNYFFQVGTFRSTDISELSDHITIPSLTKIALQKETQPIVWGLRADGALVSMIYNRDDASVTAGWTRHILGGQSDSAGSAPFVYSFGFIPSKDLTFDQMWLIVKRYINGQTIYSVEYMTKIFDDSVLQEDASQLDCGATFDNPKTITGITNASPAVVTSAAHGFSNGDVVRFALVNGLNKKVTDANGNVSIVNLLNSQTFVVAGVTTNTFQLNDFNSSPIDSTTFGAYVSGGQVRKLVTTISGLTWLENETVSVLADGGVHPDVVVSNSGVVTLKYPAAKVQLGYSSNSDGQLLRVDAGAADGTSIGKIRRTIRAAVQLYRSGELKLGTAFTNLIPVSLFQADAQLADQAMPLYSGIVREGIESAYDFESQICFRQSGPLPGMIQSITSFMEEFDL